MKIWIKIWRLITNDSRCPNCNCQMVPWRDGNWACYCCDLTPPRVCLNDIERVNNDSKAT